MSKSSPMTVGYDEWLIDVALWKIFYYDCATYKSEFSEYFQFNPRAVHKNGELLFVKGDTNLATCAA